MTIIFILNLLKILILVLCLLIAVAYFTLLERKLMGSIQRRRGPNVVGYLGLLQPLADGLKLFVKETILPSSSNIGLFLFAPILAFFLSLLGWAVIPFGDGVVLSNINLGLFYLLSISALNVYSILIAGWSSNSKYAFLGALRSVAQMLSYEISIGFLIISVVLCAGSYNLNEIVLAQASVWYCVPLLPVFVMFFISALAETNRHPFDLPEAEAELVSGYNVEYSGMGFALFFLGEYANMLLMSALTATLFCGGWLSVFGLTVVPSSFWLAIKIVGFAVLYCWIRAAVPRYRYDQLMNLGWKTFLPFSLSWLILTASILLTFNSLPIPSSSFYY